MLDEQIKFHVFNYVVYLNISFVIYLFDKKLIKM